MAPLDDNQAASRRRSLRRLVLGIGLPLAVVVLLVLPVFSTLQPGYYGRYADLRVRMDHWSGSTHAKMSCADCHVDPGAASFLSFAARSVPAFYEQIVAGPKETNLISPPDRQACQKCHTDYRQVSPNGDLLIPHRAHVDILKVPCVTCHRYLVHEESPEGRHTPPMAVCLTCHDGKQAKNACTTCHTAKAAPDTHKASDWLVVHPQVAKTTDCAKCHGWIDNWCADCHDRRPPSHTKDWRERHATAVAVKKPRNCESCHVASFCTECHGSVPELNRDPNATRVK